MSISITKEQSLYHVTYTNNDDNYQREMLVLAVNNTLAWEKVAEYVGIPCKCVSVTKTSGMWVLN